MSEDYQYAGFYIDNATAHVCKVIVQDKKHKFFFQEIAENKSAFVKITNSRIQEVKDRVYFFNAKESKLVNENYTVNENFLGFYLGSDARTKTDKIAFHKPVITEFAYGSKHDIGKQIEKPGNWKKFVYDLDKAYENKELLTSNDRKAILIETMLLCAHKKRGMLPKYKLKDDAYNLVRERNELLL